MWRWSFDPTRGMIHLNILEVFASRLEAIANRFDPLECIFRFGYVPVWSHSLGPSELHKKGRAPTLPSRHARIDLLFPFQRFESLHSQQ